MVAPGWLAVGMMMTPGAPRLADQYATMRVLNGTRELGDYDGNYALALVDGENKVTIEVTSPDKTVTKNYDLTIYRNEEEKLKNLEPLEAEDINSAPGCNSASTGCRWRTAAPG